MVVFNIKVNKKSIFKLALSIMLIICITLCLVGAYMLFSKNYNNEINNVNDNIPSNEITEISAENYTNILQAVHKNINTYLGQKISFIGYVYKADGFSDNQFVIARDMDIGNNQTLIVGFLCNYENAKDLALKSWVKITGEISSGEYNGSNIPIINILSLEEAGKPLNPNVPVPDDEYVPTAVIY